MTIYELGDHSIWTGRSRELKKGEGRPSNWTPIAPPEVPDGQMAQLRGGSWVIIDAIPTSDLIRQLRDAKTRAVQRINAAYQAELGAILADYPESETKTWDKQEAEARAYAADGTASTPLIDAIAESRSMDKAELVSRIIVKAGAWIAASGRATGKRQALEDAIANTVTLEDVEAIQW